MALTLKELTDLTKEHYHLKILTSHRNFDYVVTWVNMMEDPSITEFFWGNELVVSSGYTLKEETMMFDLIDTLVEHRCTGLVFNIGKYIHEIPKALIQYCEEKNLPLMTMPWHMSITEFVKECCFLINQSNYKEELLTQSILHIVHAPYEAGTYRAQLDEFFQEGNGLQMISIRPKFIEIKNTAIVDQRSVLRLHTAMRPYNFPYVIFRYEKRFMILINQKNPTVAKDIARRILKLIHIKLSDLTIRIGISNIVNSYEKLSNCFHESLSASRRAISQNLEIVHFEEMGIYKILYSVPDHKLLHNYYEEVMSPLLSYDEKHHSAYTETLIRYLLNNGSLQEVANQMFTHRNTVNYRMGKIRELLHCELSTPSERFPYLIAYHIGIVLNLQKDLESNRD